MSEQALTREPKATRRGGGLFRRALRLLMRLFLCWLALIVVLSGLYTFVPPVSTLMIGDWLQGKSVLRDYVPLDEISPYLPRAIISSEDAGFCSHGGVDWREMGNVIKTALRRGTSRGASTIPMQTAKNLFLLSQRSYIRKGLEIPLALFLNSIWSKRRMMEVYLNIAEWGDGIYGAEAAAQFYFKKSAKALTQREAALLAVALPNPLLRNPARPAGYQVALAGRLMQRMNNDGALDFCFR